MFIDTHCHLTDEVFTGGNLDTAIANAHNACVDVIVCATAAPAAFAPAIEIANKYDNVFCTIGMHPDCAGQNPDDFINDKMLQNPRVIGVGEIGLDYHTGDGDRGAQIDLFERQLEIARAAKLPVAIHTRDAEDDTIAILTNVHGGVMHCFTGSWNLAHVMLNRGFYFSASGILTFKNATDIRETFAKIPRDRVVIETDSPWCAPVPYRGRPCEPAFVVQTARVLADIWGLQLGELESILMENTKRLYPKIKL